MKVLTEKLILEEISNAPAPSGARHGVSDAELRAVLLGCKFCGFNYPETYAQVSAWYGRHEQVVSFLANWRKQGLTVPWVRVGKDMTLQAREGNAATYRRFSALCAVNAAIGSKPYSAVTTGRMRAGMLGYAGSRVIFGKDGELHKCGRELLKERDDNAQPITRSQARTLFDNLVAGGLLHRFRSYRGGLTYYSKTFSAEQIGEAVLRKASRKASNPRLGELAEAIQHAKNGALLSGDLVPQAESPLNREESPPSRHPVATRQPPSRHLMLL